MRKIGKQVYVDDTVENISVDGNMINLSELREQFKNENEICKFDFKTEQGIRDIVKDEIEKYINKKMVDEFYDSIKIGLNQLKNFK